MRRRPHAFAARERAPAPTLEEAGENFGIRFRGKRLAAPAQLLAELEIVVELAVVGEPRRVDLKRLIGSRREIDDLQARVQEVHVAAVAAHPVA